jgi:hypothetical protein
MLWTSIHSKICSHDTAASDYPANVIQNGGIGGEVLIFVSPRTIQGVAWIGAGVARWQNNLTYSL